MTHMNATNFHRNVCTSAAIAQMPTPNMEGTTRRERRKAAAILRQKLSNTGVMDNLNEVLAKAGLHMHPTRGIRRINPKRTVASNLVDLAKAGFGASMAEARWALTGVAQ